MQGTLKQSGALSTLSILLAIAAPASNAADKDPIADYQADLSPGPVSASEVLGLSASAITTIQSPKDFVVAINALSSGGKADFGLAFTPGRTRFAPVSIGDYQANPFWRAWAGTTFSYAQNTNTQAGVDYSQQAYAVNLAYYLSKEDDPAVAAHQGFEQCTALVKLAGDRTDRLLAIRKQLRAEGVSDEDANELARQRLKKEEGEFASKATPVYKACVDDAIGRAKAKWNASQLALTAGEGTIRDPATGSSRLSLGRIYSLAVALGPSENNLVNVTVRRNVNALELSTIATTPSYKDSTVAGARWTYRAIDTQDLYALGEVSNVKASSTTTSNVFKYALGVDKRLTEGIWIELRVGRNHTQDGCSEQTTALMSVKLSPKSSLAP